jgi:DNA-binding MarR family transcriptional regulator
MRREERVENLFLSTQSMIRGWKSYFQKVLAPEKLSPMLMMLLFYIGGHQPVSGRKIGEALQLSPSAASQLIEGLSHLGYITRETAAQDRRITYFGLTVAGEDKVIDLQKKRMEYFMRVTAHLSDEEIDTLVKLQQKLTQEVKSHIVAEKGEQ